MPLRRNRTPTAILGVSDIHRLVDHDYDMAGGEHRTVTLAPAGERSTDALKAAFKAHRTVAYYQHELLGRETEVRSIVEASLSSTVRGMFSQAALLRQ